MASATLIPLLDPPSAFAFEAHAEKENPSSAESTERRAGRRIHGRWPLRVSQTGAASEGDEWTSTSNIAAGGVYFESRHPRQLAVGTRLNLELVVPPGLGHSPYYSRVAYIGEVAWTHPISPADPHKPAPRNSLGVAVRFVDGPVYHF